MPDSTLLCECLSAVSMTDYLHRTNWAVIGGYGSLSRASDLVGHACGFTNASLAPPLPTIRQSLIPSR